MIIYVCILQVYYKFIGICANIFTSGAGATAFPILFRSESHMLSMYRRGTLTAGNLSCAKCQEGLTCPVMGTLASHLCLHSGPLLAIWFRLKNIE